MEPEEKKNINDKGKVTDEQQFCLDALKKFNFCLEAQAQQREVMLEDLKFKNGQQWPEDVIKRRENDHRPALVENRILAHINHVVNDGLQNTPNIKPRPVDDFTDQAKADVVGGLIRHIVNSDDGYDSIKWAYDNAVSCGLGYFRVITEYEHEKSFLQDIKLERIGNPACVYIPYHLCKRADFSDAPYAFIREKISKEEFKDRWPDIEVEGFNTQGVGDPNWIEKDAVWIAEYFIAREETKTIYLLDDGSTVEQLVEGRISAKERKTRTRKIFRYLITDGKVLEDEMEWPSKYIPVVVVAGQEININGEKNFVSLTRFGKDPQKMHNYWITAFTEQVALQPIAPFIAAEGQVEGYERLWQTLNTKPQAYVPYKPIALNGELLPRPSRLEPPAIGTAIVQGIQMSIDGLKATTGIFDASLGSEGNEKSGRAIMARQRQGDVANYHFTNNLNRAIMYLGRILIDLIPKIYDVPRTIRILGEDQTTKVVMLNQEYQDPNDPDKTLLYDLTVGRYDITVDVGPSYQSKRLEAADALTQIITAVPQIGAVCSDILVRNLDFPGASELSERLKKTIPPHLLEDTNKNGGAVSEAEIRAIVADLQSLQQSLQLSAQENAQLKQMIAKMDFMLKDKAEDRQMRMDTAVIRADAELKKAKMQLAHDASGRIMDTALQLHGMSNTPTMPMSNGAAPAQNAESTGQQGFIP